MYGTPQDVTNLVSFPRVDDAIIAGWLAQRSADLDLLLAQRSVQVPLTAPETLVTLLTSAAVYGAAANVAMSQPRARTGADRSSAADLYQSEYQRIYDQLEKMTAQNFASLGATMTTVAVDTTALGPVGLGVVRSDYDLTRRLSWDQAYPFRPASRG